MIRNFTDTPQPILRTEKWLVIVEIFIAIRRLYLFSRKSIVQALYLSLCWLGFNFIRCRISYKSDIARKRWQERVRKVKLPFWVDFRKQRESVFQFRTLHHWTCRQKNTTRNLIGTTAKAPHSWYSFRQKLLKAIQRTTDGAKIEEHWKRTPQQRWN